MRNPKECDHCKNRLPNTDAYKTSVQRVGHGRYKCSLCGSRGNSVVADSGEYQRCRICGEFVGLATSPTTVLECKNCGEIYKYDDDVIWQWKCMYCQEINAYYMTTCIKCKVGKAVESKEFWKQQERNAEPPEVQKLLKLSEDAPRLANEFGCMVGIFVAVSLLSIGLFGMAYDLLMKVKCMTFGCTFEECVKHMGRWFCG